ncbi:MAG: hypothetical protein WC312_03705 [Candidatus Omnitrophota bacterium]|jgi:hypothetical protein
MPNPLTDAYERLVKMENGKLIKNWQRKEADDSMRRARLIPWLVIAGFLFFMVILFIATARGEEYTDEQIVRAIFLAEGGYKVQYLYGIRSVKYSDINEARRICFNTVRNNRRRYADYGYKKYKTYLEFLASRYCPIGCDNDSGTNKYWLRNVKYFLAKGK